ncbi:esterase family protein [Roseibacterium beibuensis]|uniref:alpha/beta hydrolase n=1 Tax=[Roseibacterium] beibuensis TaxID=1193142 RepID=UPI00217E43A3|nr:esterase family protein [Roseibacterium beibuensis]MCS6625375.1 esterase family protein [Roseibacterium beibuensis]
MRRLASPLVVALAVLAGCSSAPPRPVDEVPLNHLPALAGDYFQLDSRHVGRGFHIYVRLPEGYDPAAATLYPTVYLTDGDSLFPILAANHLFLTYDDGLPEAIVVGVAYGGFDPSVNRRNIDFQSPGAGVTDAQAGAEEFQRFLKTELIPQVERRYRSDPSRRVLFGQSRGGAFVLYSAVTDPDLFWGRIASNPSITPGAESLLEPAAPASRRDLALVLTSGTRDRPDLQREAALWISTWTARPERPWRLFGPRIEGGTHAANASDAYRMGMNWLFDTDAAP